MQSSESQGGVDVFFLCLTCRLRARTICCCKAIIYARSAMDVICRAFIKCFVQCQARCQCFSKSTRRASFKSKKRIRHLSETLESSLSQSSSASLFSSMGIQKPRPSIMSSSGNFSQRTSIVNPGWAGGLGKSGSVFQSRRTSTASTSPLLRREDSMQSASSIQFELDRMTPTSLFSSADDVDIEEITPPTAANSAQSRKVGERMSISYSGQQSSTASWEAYAGGTAQRSTKRFSQNPWTGGQQGSASGSGRRSTLSLASLLKSQPRSVSPESTQSLEEQRSTTPVSLFSSRSPSISPAATPTAEKRGRASVASPRPESTGKRASIAPSPSAGAKRTSMAVPQSASSMAAGRQEQTSKQLSMAAQASSAKSAPRRFTMAFGTSTPPSQGLAPSQTQFVNRKSITPQASPKVRRRASEAIQAKLGLIPAKPQQDITAAISSPRPAQSAGISRQELAARTEQFVQKSREVVIDDWEDDETPF